MTTPEDAVTAFKEGTAMNCAQAILSTYSPKYGLGRAEALRLALAFGAGMGRMGLTCGAVTGAFMVLSLKHTLGNEPGMQRKENTYDAVKKFSEEFKARNGSLYCKDLLGCDLSTPEGFKKASETNAITTKCPKYVKDAAEILEEMLKK
ncbi:MAG: C-GCAxxG-C-C family protein [Candidatus Altiarchaeota archaeon]|nr:C-GCAxxG-C-C family protein [Candidatus Altiarchaeota archaeon]